MGYSAYVCVCVPARCGSCRGYQLPSKGMFQLITCPNYFGEIVEWLGLAIAMQSMGAAVFALYTAANLGIDLIRVTIKVARLPTSLLIAYPLRSIEQDCAGPRALSHHRWYKSKFESYPQSRKALIPYVL